MPTHCEIAYREQVCEVILTWETENVDTVCLFSYTGDSGTGDQIHCPPSGDVGGGDYEASVGSGKNTFTLRAGMTSSSQELDSVEVEGINLPGFKILEFDPPSVGPGESSTLRWEAEYADECSSEQVEEVEDAMGRVSIRRGVEGDWPVTVVCEGENGNEVSETVTLTVDIGEPWLLLPADRKAYLEHYSPVIFKRANEDDNDHVGYDLITNFDFDRDGMFSTNRKNWVELVRFDQREPATESWRIRPTVYTAALEFTELSGAKTVVLLYHVYHAMQEGGIHDWERIEIHVQNVSGTPGGGGEDVSFVVITRHDNHHFRPHPDNDLNFMQSRTGEHVLVWQAQWSGFPLELHRAELRFVEDDWNTIEHAVEEGAEAEVEITGDGEKKNVNYVFVCDCSTDAASSWNARAIDQGNFQEHTARVRERVSWNEVPRVTYELQDIADILPTHTAGGGYENHWAQPVTTIRLESPLLAEDGVNVEVDAGFQPFYYAARDNGDIDEEREGYPYKSWFWGAYDLGGDDDIKRKAYEGDKDAFEGGTRADASEDAGSLDAYWRQHDYFAHDGEKGGDGESGRWLPLGWQKEENGGFDGRWVQLFEDG